ncbi:hypothetical protein Tco_0365051 [Tanacetum coccineum]
MAYVNSAPSGFVSIRPAPEPSTQDEPSVNNVHGSGSASGSAISSSGDSSSGRSTMKSANIWPLIAVLAKYMINSSRSLGAVRLGSSADELPHLLVSLINILPDPEESALLGVQLHVYLSKGFECLGYVPDDLFFRVALYDQLVPLIFLPPLDCLNFFLGACPLFFCLTGEFLYPDIQADVRDATVGRRLSDGVWLLGPETIAHSIGMTLLLCNVTVPPSTGNFNIPCAVDGTARRHFLCAKVSVLEANMVSPLMNPISCVVSSPEPFGPYLFAELAKTLFIPRLSEDDPLSCILVHNVFRPFQISLIHRALPSRLIHLEVAKNIASSGDKLWVIIGLGPPFPRLDLQYSQGFILSIASPFFRAMHSFVLCPVSE